MAHAAETVRLREDTLLAFTGHVRAAEAAMKTTLNGNGTFLWSNGSEEHARKVRKGTTLAELRTGQHPTHVPEGLIHDWIGAVYIPRATASETLSVLQRYDDHKNIYKPDVIGSRLIGRSGDEFDIFLRILKKKLITVVLDTHHHVRYFSPRPGRWCCHSFTTSITEVEDHGKTSEWAHPPDAGYGFLWRLNSYWRFEEKDGGVYLECRAISLTRDMPTGLGWIIEPIIKKFPRESLVATLESTAKALALAMEPQPA